MTEAFIIYTHFDIAGVVYASRSIEKKACVGISCTGLLHEKLTNKQFNN